MTMTSTAVRVLPSLGHLSYQREAYAETQGITYNLTIILLITTVVSVLLRTYYQVHPAYIVYGYNR